MVCAWYPHHDYDIQWDKSRVYSYTLVIAGIWYRQDDLQGDWRKSPSILSALVAESLTNEDEENNLLLMKSTEPDDTNSFLQLVQYPGRNFQSKKKMRHMMTYWALDNCYSLGAG